MAKEQFTDAIMLLRSDHEEVKGLFDQFENASGTERKRQIAERICNELKIHSMIEEEEMPREGMFAKCRDTDVDLKALLEPMMARKEELMALAESEGLPPAQLAAVEAEASA